MRKKTDKKKTRRVVAAGLAVVMLASAVPASVAAATVEELPDAASAIGSALKSAGATISRFLQDSVTQLGQQNLQQVSVLSQTGKSLIPPLASATTDGVDGDFKYNNLFNGTAEITDYTGSATNLTIPSEVDGLKVVKFGDRAFSGCTSLTEVTIPDSVTNIGASTFSDCTSLKKVTIPDSVTDLHATFVDCTSLEEVTIPHSVISLWSTFEGCTSLTEVTIPNSVMDIGDWAFLGCTSLAKVTIPDSVTSIGYKAFEDCTSLIEVTIPKGVTEIGSEAFKGCTSLAEVEIPNSVTSIGGYTFSSCTSLTEVMIPDSVETIESFAFAYCTSLTSVKLGSGLKTIGDYIFSGTGITEIVIPKSVTSMGNLSYSGGALEGAEELSKVEFEEGMETIPVYALLGCISVKEVVIPYGVRTIESGAFQSCNSLTEITIPNSVTSIGSLAFLRTPIHDIYYGGTEEQWNNIDKSGSGFSYDVTIHYNSTGIEPVFSDYRIGTVEDAWKGENYLEYWVKIDGTVYQAGDTGIVMLPEYVKGKKLAYALDDQGRIGKYAMVSEPNTAQVSSYDAQRRSLRLGSDTTEYFLADTLTDPSVLQNPEAFIGKTVQYTTVSLYDSLNRHGISLVDVAPIESHVGKLTNLDVLSDPWQVYLKGHDQPFPVDMSDEFLQDQLLSLQQKDTVITLIDGVVDKAYTPASLIHRSITVKSDVDDYQDYIGGAPFGGKPSLSWEDGKYKHDEIVLSVTLSTAADDILGDTTELAAYFAEHAQEYKFQVNGITAIPSDNLDMLDGGTVEGMPVTLLFGESRTFTIPIKVHNGWFQEEPNPSIITGDIDIQVDGGWGNKSVPFEVRNEKLIAEEEQKRREEEQKRQEEAEKHQTQINAAAEKAAAEYKKLLDEYGEGGIPIALPADLEQYLTQREAEAVRVTILTQIAIAKSDQESLEEAIEKGGADSAVSEKVVDAMMEMCFGVANYDIEVERIEVPVELKIETKEYGTVHTKLLCEIDNYNINDWSFGANGEIRQEFLRVEKGRQPAVPGDGMIYIANIKGFYEGAKALVMEEVDSILELFSSDDFKNLVIDEITKEFSEGIIRKTAERIVEKVMDKIEDLPGELLQNAIEVVYASSKRMSIHCPVDLYIYNAEGALAGSIINDQAVSLDDNLQLWTNGDSKYIYILDGEYNIVYEARENGTMKVEISELGADNTNLRTVTFEEVPLVEGNLYTGNIEDAAIQDYTLTAGNGIVLDPDAITENQPEEPTGLPGDVNGDGSVTAVDVRIVHRAAAGLETLTDEQKVLADMDGDGNISAVDVRRILQIASGM